MVGVGRVNKTAKKLLNVRIGNCWGSENYLEVPLGGEGIVADCAAEGFVPSMRSHVNLQSRR